MIALHPYQVPGLDKFLARPDKRLFLAWEMGAGKTFGAGRAVELLAPDRALFVVPAVDRPKWGRFLKQYFPERDVGVIRMGRGTKSGTKSALAQRDAAYQAPWQVVSYDLLGQTDLGPWDFFVIDEVHNLRNPLSGQSKDVRARVRANPAAAALGLSGTLIPNEAHQIWNPLDIFYPGAFGPPSKTGDVSWNFKARYCHKEIGYGGHPRYFGLRDDAREKLQAAVDPVSHRVVQADFAAYLPPLFVEPLYVESARIDREKLALDWVSERTLTEPKVGVFTHLRETAHATAERLRGRFPHMNMHVITGADSVEKRDRMLTESREQDNCIIVGTTHALQEGISLSHLKAALVVEWTTAMSDVLQFIARFARQDSATLAPTRVELVVGPNDESRLATIRERIEAFSSVFKAGRAESLATDAFRERQMTDAEFQRELDAITTGVEKRAKFKGFTEVEDEEDDDE